MTLQHQHIPGSSTYRADKESRDFRSEDTEWMIDPTLLGKALDALNFKSQSDLFASRVNRQFPIYCSLKPDPDASYIDVFTARKCGFTPNSSGVKLRNLGG